MTVGAVIDVLRHSNTSLEQNQRLIDDSRTKPFRELKSQFAAKKTEREQILSVNHLTEQLFHSTTTETPSLPKLDFPSSFIY